jgi:hypothetical protein
MRLAYVASLLLIAGTLTAAVAQQAVQMKKPGLTASACHTGMKLDSTQIFQNYRTRTYRSYDDDGCIEIDSISFFLAGVASFTSAIV